MDREAEAGRMEVEDKRETRLRVSLDADPIVSLLELSERHFIATRP